MLTWTLRIVAVAIVLLLLVRAGRAAMLAIKPDPARFAPPRLQPKDRAPPGAEAAAPLDAAPRALDDLLEPIRARRKIPALAGAIVTGEKGLVAVGAAGVRVAGGTERVTADDLWHIGSCTKNMTATLCAILVEEGRLAWTTTLADVFPGVAPAMHADFRAVTLEQLCTNRGGVPTGLDAGGLWAKLWQHEGTPTDARRLLLESVTARPPAYPPGSRTVYSNGGFAIAGHICETVAGVTYERLMAERLFAPLGMTSAGFGAPGTPGATDQPRGHTGSNKAQEPTADGRGADNPPAISPAGRVHCTMADWAKFIRMHLRGARGEAQRVGDVTLSAETFRRLHTPPEGGDYAMGWVRMQRPWAGPEGRRDVLFHNGSNTMWFAVVWMAPEKDFAVLAACNQGGREAEKACDEAAWGMIQEHLGSSP